MQLSPPRPFGSKRNIDAPKARQMVSKRESLMKASNISGEAAVQRTVHMHVTFMYPGHAISTKVLYIYVLLNICDH
jgi:hypothetical protein